MPEPDKIDVFRFRDNPDALMALGMAHRSQVVCEMLSHLVTRLKRFPRHFFPH
jgi:hypothetical protein